MSSIRCIIVTVNVRTSVISRSYGVTRLRSTIYLGSFVGGALLQRTINWYRSSSPALPGHAPHRTSTQASRNSASPALSQRLSGTLGPTTSPSLLRRRLPASIGRGSALLWRGRPRFVPAAAGMFSLESSSCHGACHIIYNLKYINTSITVRRTNR